MRPQGEGDASGDGRQNGNPSRGKLGCAQCQPARYQAKHGTMDIDIDFRSLELPPVANRTRLFSHPTPVARERSLGYLVAGGNACAKFPDNIQHEMSCDREPVFAGSSELEGLFLARDMLSRRQPLRTQRCHQFHELPTTWTIRLMLNGSSHFTIGL